MSPMLNFLEMLGLKYLVSIVVVSAIIASTLEFLVSSRSFTLWWTLLNTATLGVIVISITFVVYVAARVLGGEDFPFFSLMLSASFFFFWSALAISLHDVLTGQSAFHILMALLPAAVSIVVGAMFSLIIQVAQKFLH